MANAPETSQSQANKNKDNLKGQAEPNKRSTEFGNKNDPNFDPSQQNAGLDAGKPSNPNASTPRNMAQGEGDLHPIVETSDRLKASGKHVGGVPHQPIVTLNPTSEPVDSQGKQKFKTISNALDLMFQDTISSSYEGLTDIKAGYAILVTVAPGKTIDQTIMEAQKEVKRLNDLYSVDAVNEDGEQIQDSVLIKEFKRNSDQTIQLDDKSKPITGANAGYVNRKIQIRQYVAKPVTKDDKISDDGVLIVRVL